MAALKRYCLARALIAIAALIGTVSSAFASAGCDLVNSGAWNITLSILGTGYTPPGTFVVGDVIHVTGSLQGGTGGFSVNGFNGALATTPAPGTINFTVTDPNDSRSSSGWLAAQRSQLKSL